MRLARLVPIIAVAAAACATPPRAQGEDLEGAISAIREDVIAWRRDIHEHPELGNREFRTSKLVSDHLRSLGLEVREGIASTGVVGVLKGGRRGPTIALRADMDALPMEEDTGLSFASRVTADYNGEMSPVMHACGHDAHTAMLMGAASVLAARRSEIAGTILFVFQPAEEGPPEGEPGGASQMLLEGVFEKDKPEAMFALHVEPGPVGRIYTRPRGFLAGAHVVRIGMNGAGTHAARPWAGNDLVNMAADIIETMNVITARKVDAIEEPSVVSLAHVEIGNRSNVLSPTGTMAGTVRTYSEGRFQRLREEITNAVSSIATIYGASADVNFADGTPPTVNDGELLKRVLPALERAAGAAGVDADATRRPAAEDFSFFAREIPSVYFILGSTKNFTSFAEAPSNHSPQFDIDEDVLQVGVRAHVMVALSYLESLDE